MHIKTIFSIAVGILLLACSFDTSIKAHAAVTSITTKNNNPIIGSSDAHELLHYVRGGNRGRGRASRGRNVNRNSNRNVNVNRNSNRNVNVNVNVRHRGYGWRGTRWGAVAFGVTIGATIIVVVNTPPPPPHPTVCWTWSNSALTRGYWYYCSGP